MDGHSEKEELKLILTKMLTNIEKKSKLKLGKDERESLLNNMAELVFKNKNYKDLLSNPEFNKKLTVIMMVGISTKQVSFEKFIKGIEGILKNKNFDLKKLMTMSGPDLNKFLKQNLAPNELKLINTLVSQLSKDLNKNLLDNFNGPTPKPGKEKESLENEGLINLLGVFPYMTGGIAIPVTTFIGNGLGIVDYNPNNGNANIDKQNSIQDTQFADSMGLNAETLNNYAKLGGSVSEAVLSAEPSQTYTSPSDKMRNPLSTKLDHH